WAHYYSRNVPPEHFFSSEAFRELRSSKRRTRQKPTNCEQRRVSNEVFRFSYTYQQANKPVSSVTIDLGDSLRRVSVSGESADQVEALSKLLEKDFRRYAVAAGGLKFRRVTGVCLSMLFLTSLMISSTY